MSGMDDSFFFGLPPHKIEDTFLDVLPNGNQPYRQFEPQMYPVIQYEEKLYLNHALIVATHTVWRFMVTEDRDAFANAVQVDVSGKFEPFNETHSVTMAIIRCQSMEEYQTLSKARRVINDVPTWKAYHVPGPGAPPDKQNSIFCVVLSKPQKWGSQMMPVSFYFRGTYANRNAYWEKYSSPAIMLTNSASKWYEKAFITLALLGLGYDPKAISKPDAVIRWEDFIAVADLHMVGSTECRRKLSDNISFLSRFHMESLASMVGCDADRKVTLKKVRHFCNESSDGTPPLKLIETVICRYKQSWETGAIVGIIRSGIVKQYLLEQNHPPGSFVLRIQYNSPSEMCASSVQVNPQTGVAFVDHLTISEHVAPDDHGLQDYLACSPIHKIMLPMQAICSRPATSTSLEPSQTYRTTNQEFQRTSQLLQQAFQEGFQVAGGGRDTNSQQMSPTDSMGFGVPSPQSPVQSPLPHTPSMDQQQVGQLDEQVLSYLRYFFRNDPELFQEVAPKFAQQRVTANSFLMLDANDLREMGIPLGPRKLLLQALQQLNSQYQPPRQ